MENMGPGFLPDVYRNLPGTCPSALFQPTMQGSWPFLSTRLGREGPWKDWGGGVTADGWWGPCAARMSGTLEVGAPGIKVSVSEGGGQRQMRS